MILVLSSCDKENYAEYYITKEGSNLIVKIILPSNIIQLKPDCKTIQSPKSPISCLGGELLRSMVIKINEEIVPLETLKYETKNNGFYLNFIGAIPSKEINSFFIRNECFFDKSHNFKHKIKLNTKEIRQDFILTETVSSRNILEK